MGFLGTHESAGLPVFGESDVAWDKADIARAPLNGRPFLRRTEVDISRLNAEVTRGISLTNFLVLADAALVEAASAVDAQVLDHTWALAQMNPYSLYRRKQALVPDGYQLIASVKNMAGAEPLPLEEAVIVNGLATAFKGRSHDAGYFMYDLSAGQCVIDHNGDRVLLDIEPRLASDGIPLGLFDGITR